MANTTHQNYDTSIGTKERSVVAATKLWAIVIGLILLLGIAMLFVFMASSDRSPSGGMGSDNSATGQPGP